MPSSLLLEELQDQIRHFSRLLELQIVDATLKSDNANVGEGGFGKVDIPLWQPWVGLVGVMLFTIFAVWLGGRIFRIGILMAGGPPKLGKMLRWAFRG